MGTIISAILEFIVLSLPSGVYLAVRARHGHSRESRGLVGLCWPTASGWILAVGVFVIATGLGYAASRGIAVIHPAPPHAGDSNPGVSDPRGGHTGGGAGLSVATGSPAGAGGYAAIVLTTLAEEMLFRGFLAGLLIRRLGFARGNTVQAVLFLAPHALLLVIGVAFWPLVARPTHRGVAARVAALPQRVHRPGLGRPRRREHPRPPPCWPCDRAAGQPVPAAGSYVAARGPRRGSGSEPGRAWLISASRSGSWASPVSRDAVSSPVARASRARSASRRTLGFGSSATQRRSGPATSAPSGAALHASQLRACTAWRRTRGTASESAQCFGGGQLQVGGHSLDGSSSPARPVGIFRSAATKPGRGDAHLPDTLGGWR